MRLIFEVVSLALLAVAPVQPAASPEARADAPNPSAPRESEPEILVQEEAPRRICETRHDTGSIIPRRVCRTPEQVAADEEKARFIKEQLSRDREAAQHTQESRANR